MHRTLLALLATTTLACSGAQRDDEAIGATSSAIVGGQADDADPSVVALVAGTNPYCSGTLVAKRTVLTAAHCVVETPPRAVLFGATPASAKRVEVASFRAHPSFSEDTLAHDVAIVTLAADAPEAPAMLADSAPRGGSRVRVVGFGDEAPGAAPDTRRKRTGFDRVDQVAPDHFRAAPDPSTPCSHDSGGAVFDGATLVGVISAGDLSCTDYAIFTRIDAHRDFVDGALAQPSDGASGCGVAPRSQAPTGLWLFLVAALRLVRRTTDCSRKGNTSCAS